VGLRSSIHRRVFSPTDYHSFNGPGDQKMTVELPDGFYSAAPEQRVKALSLATPLLRDQLLDGIDWPMYSPGAINSWLVFLGASPGASPGGTWNYDRRPSVGTAHPGVSEYEDANGYWEGIRLFARTILSELPATEAYASTMVRNLDPRQSAAGPTGGHMHEAALEVRGILDRIIRPRLIVSLGSVRGYSNRAFSSWPRIHSTHSGSLRTAISGEARKWISITGEWSTGELFRYVAPSGIHPSLRHVSSDDTLYFLSEQSQFARSSSRHSRTDSPG